MKEVLGLVSFLLLDAVYLKLISNYFGKQVKNIQGSDMNVNKIAAAVVYTLIGVQWYFMIFKKINKEKMKSVLFKAFLLGLTTYGIFDFTNMAIFKNYTLKTALIDSVWGGTLYFLVTLLQYKM